MASDVWRDGAASGSSARRVQKGHDRARGSGADALPTHDMRCTARRRTQRRMASADGIDVPERVAASGEVV